MGTFVFLAYHESPENILPGRVLPISLGVLRVSLSQQMVAPGQSFKVVELLKLLEEGSFAIVLLGKAEGESFDIFLSEL